MEEYSRIKVGDFYHLVQSPSNETPNVSNHQSLPYGSLVAVVGYAWGGIIVEDLQGHRYTVSNLNLSERYQPQKDFDVHPSKGAFRK